MERGAAGVLLVLAVVGRDLEVLLNACTIMGVEAVVEVRPHPATPPVDKLCSRPSISSPQLAFLSLLPCANARPPPHAWCLIPYFSPARRMCNELLICAGSHAQRARVRAEPRGHALSGQPARPAVRAAVPGSGEREPAAV